MEKKVKQVLVWRHDLKVRKGKFGAQIAHASVALLLNAMHHYKGIYTIDAQPNTDWGKWISGKFTKIVLSCEGEKELLQLYGEAKAAGLPCVLITDAGLTEFDGVPTNTCIGIGPASEDEINKITGHLKPY